MPPVSREQFDADLQASTDATTALVAADTDYIAAVDAFIALPQIIDLTNEDDQVKAGLQNVTDAKAAVEAAKSRIPQPSGGGG